VARLMMPGNIRRSGFEAPAGIAEASSVASDSGGSQAISISTTEEAFRARDRDRSRQRPSRTKPKRDFGSKVTKMHAAKNCGASGYEMYRPNMIHAPWSGPDRDSPLEREEFEVHHQLNELSTDESTASGGGAARWRQPEG